MYISGQSQISNFKKPVLIETVLIEESLYSVLPITHTVRVHSYLLKGTVRIIGRIENLFATKYIFLQHLVCFSENKHLISIFPQSSYKSMLSSCSYMIIINKPKLNDA